MNIVEADAASVIAGEFFAHPLVIALATALVTIIIGGWVGNVLAHQWQLRSQRYQFKLKAYERFQFLFTEWMQGMKKKDGIGLTAIRVEFVFLATLFENERTRFAVLDFEIGLREAEEVWKSGELKKFDDAVDALSDKYAEVVLSATSEMGFKKF